MGAPRPRVHFALGRGMPSKQQLSLSYLGSQSRTESALRGGEAGFYLAEGFAGLIVGWSVFPADHRPCWFVGLKAGCPIVGLLFRD